MKILIKKLISWIIDYTILGGLTSIFYFSALFFLQQNDMMKSEFMMLCACIILFLFGFYIPCSRKATLGESLMNLRVMRKDGNSLTYTQVFAREFVLKFLVGPFFILFTFLYIIIYNLIIHHDIHEELSHDYIMNTEVIDVEMKSSKIF